ncbi:MAG: hypothetical protein ACE5I3_16115, partial [Phycisphaerae bacterium]
AISWLMEETGTTTQSPYAEDLYCPECGYSLRGLTSARCPECGLLLDFIESEVSLIPWERRREIGWIRAYWRTVLLVMFRHKVFHRAFYQPVSHRDAQCFRGVSILHACVPAWLAVAAFYLLEHDAAAATARFAGSWFIPFCCACLLTCLYVVSGLPSYMFDSELLADRQRARAAALGCYGCASLAWMPVAFAAFLAGLILRRVYPTAGVIVLAISGGLALVALIWSGEEPLRLGKRIFRGKRSKWLLEFQFGIIWLICFFAILVGLPFGAWLVYVVVDSLR